MIQDIAPEKLDNQFKKKEIHENAIVLIFDGRNVLVGKAFDEKNESCNLILPTFQWLCENKLFDETDDKRQFQYVFSIGEKTHEDYFIFCSYKNKMRLDKIKSFVENREETDILFSFEMSRNMRQLDSKKICFAIATGQHLFQWYETNQFCGRCGNDVVLDEKERMLRCPKCGNMIFPKIAPAVIVAVYSGNRILMTKYNASRVYQKYALIAGFTEIGETAEETVKREVFEEVGLHVKNVKYYKSQPWGVDSNLLLGFFAELDGDDQIKLDESELSKAEWFSRDEMPAHDDGISLTREMMGIFEDEAQFDKFRIF